MMFQWMNWSDEWTNDIGLALQIPGFIPGLTWIMEFCSI